MIRRARPGTNPDHAYDDALVDEDVAKAFASSGFRPVERIREERPFETIQRFGGIGRSQRVVQLECLHVVVAKGRIERMTCPACLAILRKGGDYVGYRYLSRGLAVPDDEDEPSDEVR